MALTSTCRNLYAAQQFVDVTFVTIVIVTGATPRDATRSNPDTTVVDLTGGIYRCTMPSAEKQILVGAETVNSPSADGTDKLSVFNLASASGVTTFDVRKSDTTAFAAGEEGHITFMVIGA